VRLALVFGVIGHLLRRFAFAFAVPFGMATWDLVARTDRSTAEVTFGQTTWLSPVSFLVAAGVTALLGWWMGRWFRTGPVFRRSEALAVVAGAWIGVAGCGAIPYVFAGLTPVNAFFESLSGFTTTGATILTDFAQYDRAFYLWRGMTQWFGGLGVIALFVVVLPRLGIAGRQIFFAEASAAAGDAVSPQVRESARKLWILYVGLTALQTGALMFTGFGLYDAVVHSFTTMSAGGFSPHPQSIQGYVNPAAEWVFILFMVLSGTSFTLQYRAFTGRPLDFFRDREFMTYFGVMLLFSLLAGALLVGGLPTLDTLRSGAFQISSLMSSTGYASADFNEWNDALKTVLVLAMVVGGCAGSACGGAKVIRYILSAQWLGRELTQVLHPRAVIPIRYGRVTVPMDAMRAVTTLVFLFIMGYAIVGATLVLIEPNLDMVTGFSAALACLGNIGPAFGPAGPMGSYDSFSDIGKILLALSMWLGRLEIVTVIALFHPHVWRNYRWRGDMARSS
jgi:trk system potassium uptake protein TrkH